MWIDAFYIETLKRKIRLHSQYKLCIPQIQRARAQAVGDPGDLLPAEDVAVWGKVMKEHGLAWAACEVQVLGMVVGLEAIGMGHGLRDVTRRDDMAPWGVQPLTSVALWPRGLDSPDL